MVGRLRVHPRLVKGHQVWDACKSSPPPPRLLCHWRVPVAEWNVFGSFGNHNRARSWPAGMVPRQSRNHVGEAAMVPN
ncbi:hypothetical protein QJS10_CPA16g00020 [Acorus calamus]|uniref:Uncharacterized protein n=1 Tax=Acorus calamus TaxID=4465 RepID=A0AAV9CZ38_ACOCL|nr:hypothetical protein QJS10_CPA16g00020 [Acorus calamus]